MSQSFQPVLSSTFTGLALCLHGIKEQFAEELQTVGLPQCEETYSSLHQELSQLKTRPDWILGNEHTTGLTWLVAIDCFPNAGRAYRVNDGWIIVKGNEGKRAVQAKTETTVAVTPTSTPKVNQPLHQEPASSSQPQTALSTEANEVKASSEQSIASPQLEETDDKLLFDLFKFTSWDDSTDNRSQCKRIEDQLLQRALDKPYLLKRINKIKKEGWKARALVAEMEAYGERNFLACQEWLEKNGDSIKSISKRIRTSLEIKCKKIQERELNFTQKKALNDFKSHITPAVLIDGHHPNSLRHLPPSSQWDILIDETGNKFDQEADELPYGSTDLGRMVAVAVPQGITLPALKKDFHATVEPHQVVDEAVSNLLRNRVGIFGFTAKDEGSQGIHWINHVRQIARWVMMQIPLVPDTESHIHFYIENRGSYNSDIPLTAMEEIISSELHDLDRVRFGKLSLRLSIIAKDGHPYNGYVDAAAYAWGSPSPFSKDRLKKTKWEGHCLLRPDQDAMERLYLALSHQAKLSARDWYDLCGAMGNEPENGLIHVYLAELGSKIQEDPVQWHHYLSEVQAVMRLKQYRRNILGHALQWLKDWKPQGATFSPSLELELASAQLADANHRGYIDSELVGRCIDLSRELRNEMAPQCCETILRVATLSTNFFDFELMIDELEVWRNENPAVVGTLNHGKLCSARGQLYAFKGELPQAIEYFKQALAIFATLSDPGAARREILQTRTYYLTVLMDSEASDTLVINELTTHFREIIGKSDWSAIARSLASAGHDKRFAQHLFLRACISRQEAMRTAIEQYLTTKHQWVSDIEDHPWPLINAYRAWLLTSAGRKSEAVDYMNGAVSACFSEAAGVTLHWMGHVLIALARKLDIKVEESYITSLNTVCAELPNAPREALTALTGDPLQLMRAALPFNFH